MKKITFLLTAASLFFALACMPVQEEILTEVNIDIKDKDIQSLINFQDQQNTDSLVQYLSHRDPTFRFYAANAFASYQDSTVIDTLASLLKDDIDEVRIAAAFALGQMKKETAGQHLINAFVKDDSTGTSQQFNGTILEAIGKCSDEKYLEFLGTTSTYFRQDTALLEGQALGIYRYALRKITHKTGTEKMLAFLTKSGYPSSVRLIAAHYLSRTSGIKLDTLGQTLSKVYQEAENANIKMALALALGKTKDPVALATLKESFTRETDYRIKCNIIRAFKNFDYIAIKEIVFNALQDKNRHVSNAAAQFFIDNGVSNEANFYRQKAKDTLLHWSTQTKMKAASNRHLPFYLQEYKAALNWQLKQEYGKTTDTQQRIGLIEALAQNHWNYRIFSEYFNSPEAAIRSASVNALASIVNRPKFNKLFGSRQISVKNNIRDYLIQAVTSDDVGMTAIAANTLNNEKADFKSILADTTITLLEKTQLKLKLPKEIETYNEIQKLIDQLSGSKISNVFTPENNHPINWRRINNLGKEPQAIIQCTQGNIVVDLFPEQAPASVANFVELSKQGFYDGKKIHRVVSNFVIQGGCPRGDGYGSLDYTIRSELPKLYYNDGGYLGMASAGNHTECTQWFITHSPTPHLDGNYTIFGKVSEGMDVVHNIFPGEMIKSVVIEN